MVFSWGGDGMGWSSLALCMGEHGTFFRIRGVLSEMVGIIGGQGARREYEYGICAGSFRCFV